MFERTAIVTGGSRGIGLATARRLASDGFNVSIFSTKPVDARALLPDAGADGALATAGDLSSGADRLRLVEATLAKFGRIDALVNNAGVAPAVRADLLEMTEESWDRVTGVNTKGAMFLTQLVAKRMLAQRPAGKKRGTIIFVTSCSADTSSVTRGEYCVSKAGASMLVKLYADRLAGDGVYVHEIRPGVIETDMTSTVKPKYDAMFAGGAFPIARWGVPEDVASAVSVFCADNFLYTTGNVVEVDGGLHIKRL